MSTAERWLAGGLDEFERALSDRSVAQGEAARIRALLNAFDTPGLLAFLAGARAGDAEPKGRALLAAVAGEIVGEFPGGETALARAVGEILRGERAPREGIRDPALRRRLLERAVEEALAAIGVPATPEEIRRIAVLLESGALFSDVGGATAAILEVVPQMPVAVAGDLLAAPAQLPRLAIAFASDWVTDPPDLRTLLTDLADGRLDTPPVRLTRTLRVLFELATVEAVLATVRAWIAPENETVRLAILLFARAHGLPLEPSDLDALHAALDPARPDLGPLWIAAWDHLEARLGADALERILVSLAGAASERERH